MIKIVTDSTAMMTAEDIKKFDLEIAKLKIIIGEETFDDGELSLEAVFENIDKGINVSTSQPSPESFIDCYKKQIKKGATTIICLTVSKGLSGTLQSAQIAADIVMEDNSNVKIFPMSTGSASIGEEAVVRAVGNIILEETDAEKVIERSKIICSNGSTLLTIDDLNTVVKTGRMKKSQAVIGNFLKIKPILEMIDEEVVITQKVRKVSKTIEKYAEIVLERVNKYKNIKEIRVSYIFDRSIADRIKVAIDEILNNSVEVSIANEIGTVLAVHLGRGGFGIGFTHE